MFSHTCLENRTQAISSVFESFVIRLIYGAAPRGTKEGLELDYIETLHLFLLVDEKYL